MSEKENIVITGMARTPMGAFQGTLKDASCAELGAASIRASLERSRVGADEVSETIMGCVLPCRTGSGTGKAGCTGCGDAAFRLLYDGEQDVWIRDEIGHACP